MSDHESLQVGPERVEDVRGNGVFYEIIMAARRGLYVVFVGGLTLALAVTLAACQGDRTSAIPNDEDVPDNTEPQSPVGPENGGTIGEVADTPEVANDAKLDINQEYLQYAQEVPGEYEMELELMNYLPEGASLWKRLSNGQVRSSNGDCGYYIAVEPGPSDNPYNPWGGQYMVIGQFGPGTRMEGFDYQQYGLSDYLEYSKNYYIDRGYTLLQSAKEDTLGGTGRTPETIHSDGNLAFSTQSAEAYDIFGETDTKVIRIATRS
jgi:hypothetical protein